MNVSESIRQILCNPAHGGPWGGTWRPMGAHDGAHLELWGPWGPNGAQMRTKIELSLKIGSRGPRAPWAPRSGNAQPPVSRPKPKWPRARWAGWDTQSFLAHADFAFVCHLFVIYFSFMFH